MFEVHPEDRYLYETLRSRCLGAPRLQSKYWGLRRGADTGFYWAADEIGVTALGAALVGLPGRISEEQDFTYYYGRPYEWVHGALDGFHQAEYTTTYSPGPEYYRGFEVGRALHAEFLGESHA